ncbi:MAG: hypothetical protein FWD61_12005 [Phycisphaerales bacterium]|nr:hypothetical protein [Phycisphaerales bacterium]
MIKRAIYSLLTKDASVVSATDDLAAQVEDNFKILQPIVDTRIYSIQLPKNATQYMAEGMEAKMFMYVTDSHNDKCHDGPLDLTRAHVRIHCVASDADSVTSALVAASNLLDGWYGVAGRGQPLPPLVVQRIWSVDGVDAMDFPLGAAEFGLYESLIEVQCWYNNP